jgi:uncharacterized spore protein YtfJ
MTTDAGVLGTLSDAIGQAAADRVFGKPIQQDGVVLLPVAKVSGGGGGGSGSGPAEAGAEAGGSGGGFGLTASPAGVFVLRDGQVTWKPALDVNRIILGGQLVAVVALLVARAVIPKLRAGGGRPRARGWARSRR